MVKTLNVRGLDDYSSEVCNFLQDIESSFLDVINTYQEPKCQMVEAEKVKNTIETLGECFEAGTAPQTPFTALATAPSRRHTTPLTTS